MLKEERVGTFKMEMQALNLHLEDKKREISKSVEGKRRNKVQQIREGRDEGKVLDIIKLKLQYVQLEESKLRKEYKKERREYEAVTSARSFRRTMRRIGRTTGARWEKGMKRIRERVRWAIEKFTIPPDKVEGSFEEWIGNIAEGNREERERIKRQVPVYGVSLDEDEQDCLALPPKFCLFPKVEVDELRLEQSIGNIKSRWDRERNRDFDLRGNEVTEEEQGEKGTMEDIVKENEGREPFNPEGKTLDFRGIIPTDVKSCQRVQMPKPRSNKEEHELATRDTLSQQEVMRYIRDIERREDESINMTKGELRGLKKLKKRVKKGDIIIVQTDKSGRMAAISMDIWRRMCEVHTKCDPKVTWEDVQQSQREIKGHLRCLNHIFRPGKDNNEERVWKAKESRSTTIPVLSLLLKNHKCLEDNGDPKSRPVCGASNSMNGELSHWLSDVLEAVMASEDTDEVISSEELLAYVDELNE